MLALHCSSGLGNQMLHYADYLAYKKANPNQECYLETIIYSLDQDGICMYNGYELERIFGISVPNISSVFSKEKWEAIIKEIQASHFWANGHWDYGPVFVKAFGNQGLNMTNLCKSRGWTDSNSVTSLSTKEKARNAGKKLLGYRYNWLSNKWTLLKLSIENSHPSYVLPADGNYLCGANLNFLNRNSGMSFIDSEVRQAFRFPELRGEQNKRISEEIRVHNSVGIHFRRGDGIFTNGEYIENGYYYRALKYIKAHVENPSYFVFSLPDDTTWCRQNMTKFGLDPHKDNISFIDWNSSEDSYMDMQLMSECKHLVFGISSFAWWSAYLNSNPHKITICPVALWDTTVTIS